MHVLYIQKLISQKIIFLWQSRSRIDMSVVRIRIRTKMSRIHNREDSEVLEPYLERSQVVHSHPSGGSSGTVIPAEACKPTYHKHKVYFV